MRRAGLQPEDLIEEEVQAVSGKVFAALLRDRDAVKAHLSWHHDSMKNPDIGTIVERVLAVRGKGELERIKKLELDLALHEAMTVGPVSEEETPSTPDGENETLKRLGLTLHPEWRK